MHWESYHRLAQVWRSLRQGGKQLDPTTQADYDEIIAMDTTLTQTLRDLEFTVLKVNVWTGLAVSSFHHRFHPGRRRVTNPTRSPVDAATPQVTPPQLQATAPYETLVWDITFLPGLHRGQSYALHCVLDLYSRAIVGW